MLEVQMVLLPPWNELKMRAEYEACLAPVPQLEGSGTPALPSTTAVAGRSQRPETQPFNLFLGWLLQTMVSLLLPLPRSKLKMICKVQQQGSEAVLFMKSTYMLPSTERHGRLPGWKFFILFHKRTLLKDRWPGSEQIMLGQLFGF